jgi:hypothetical protein
MYAYGPLDYQLRQILQFRHVPMYSRPVSIIICRKLNSCVLVLNVFSIFLTHPDPFCRRISCFFPPGSRANAPNLPTSSNNPLFNQKYAYSPLFSAFKVHGFFCQRNFAHVAKLIFLYRSLVIFGLAVGIALNDMTTRICEYVQV